MKRLLSSVVLCLLTGNALLAEDKIFTVNTVEGVPMSFRVTSEEMNTCEVYGSKQVEYNGTTYDEITTAIHQNTAGTITIPEWANDYSVDAIGRGAFKDCKNLTNVVIPEGITTIDDEAFNGCKGLISVNLPQSLYNIRNGAFENCYSLTSLTIPRNISTIEENAFEGCIGLTSLVIPSTVSSIERDAFKDCTKIATITIEEGLRSIGKSAFENCSSLTSINIPASVTSINGNPFFACTMLTTISVAAGNKTYDSRDNCNAIIETAQNRLIAACKNTVIPEGITSLGSDAFGGCGGMSTLYIPASLTQGLGTGSGNGLHNILKDMTSIIVASDNPVYDSRNNCNAIIETATNKLLMGCPKTVIPNGVTTIGEEAFYRCTGLTSIDIPNSVKSIEKYAFRCSGLTSVSIPSNVKNIDKSVFEECLNLSSVTLSEGIETLGYGLFSATAITSLTIPSSVRQIGDSNGSSRYLCETCPKLSSIVVASGNSVYDSRNNCNAIIAERTWRGRVRLFLC